MCLGRRSNPSVTPVPASTDPPSATPTVINCKGGKIIKFDPLKPDLWSTLARSLFDVRLVG